MSIHLLTSSHSSSEDVLRGIFSAFGLVQTCIVNVEKRHAFVKMLTRNDAMVAKEGMERYKSSEMQLRVMTPNHFYFLRDFSTDYSID